MPRMTLKNILLTFALLTFVACKPDAEEPAPPIPPDSVVLASGTPLSQTFAAEGGRTTLAFVSSGPWTATFDGQQSIKWCRIDPAEGVAGDGQTTVTVLPNTTNTARTAVVSIRTGKAKRSVALTQQPSDLRVCSEEEVRRFLEKLYRDTDGDNWRFKGRWCSDLPLSEWGSSVKYENGRLELILGENNLRGKIDLSGCTALVSLRCAKNALTSLDVSGCPLLTQIDCTNCGIAELDVSGCYSLERILCGYNLLSRIDVSDCPYLRQLTTPVNRLDELDLSNCTELDDLNCAENRLTTLDVAGRQPLVYLFCYGNQLSELDLSGCTSLVLVNCGSNRLNGLNLAGCKKLGRIYCYDNRILSEIPESFDGMTDFEHDIRYEYRTERDEATGQETTTHIDRQIGWWYPGEPEKGAHCR